MEVNYPYSIAESKAFDFLDDIGIQNTIYWIVSSSFDFYTELKKKTCIDEFTIRNREKKGSYFYYIKVFITDIYNKLFDQIHYPHPYMIEKGIHSVTLKAI